MVSEIGLAQNKFILKEKKHKIFYFYVLKKGYNSPYKI